MTSNGPPPSVNGAKDTLPNSPASPIISYKIHRHPHNSSGPHQFECLKTDANPTRWPAIGPVVDSKGVTCQWVVSHNSVKSRWLASVGKGIAEIMGCSRNSLKKDWKLKDFPSNYQLYTYIKGTREDQYLFGSTNVHKFRTANEFLPHLQWLVSNGTTSCRCKYCSGAKNQLEVNMALGLSHASSNNTSCEPKTNPSQSADRAKRRRQSHSPHKTTQVNSSYEFQGPYLNEELNRDLLENRSNYRRHELVWCLVTDLIAGTSQEQSFHNECDLAIKFWPGLCEEMILCSESRAFISINDDENNHTASSRNLSKRRPDQSNALPSKSFKNEFETRQRYKWKIRLLGLSDIVIREEIHLLPWLFKTVDLKQKFGMKKRPGMSLPPYVQNAHHSTRPKLECFTNTEEKLVAFQLALQTAANLEEFWVAHDRYDACPDVDTSNGKTLPKMPHLMDQDGITAHLQTIWFQGIWWGAEKIWLYDVVRLNDFKRDLAFVSKPKTPNLSLDKSSVIINKKECYFLKIEGIYRDELGKRLVVMGKIFDLVRSNNNSNPAPSSISPSSPHRTNEKQRFKRSKKWMPDPPAGYEFRQITKPKEMIHLHVECISGRFYPPTQKNQSDKFAEISRRLAPKVSQDDLKINSSLPSPNNPTYQYLSNEQDQIFNDPNLVWHNASLFGLTPGQKNFMRCRKWRPSRAESISEAELLAEKEMILAYNKLQAIDDNQDMGRSENIHHNLKSFVTIDKNNVHHGNKNNRQADQNEIVVIEIDP